MLRRSIVGLLSSGGVLFLAGASGLTPVWSLVTGTFLLTSASLMLAIALEERDLERGSTGRPVQMVDLPPLERAARFR